MTNKDKALTQATEALIGMQHDCNAMMKLTEEERNSILFSVAAEIREAEARGRAAEHERLKWILAHGCLTGDCPHDREVECFNAIYDCLHEEFGEQEKSPLGTELAKK